MVFTHNISRRQNSSSMKVVISEDSPYTTFIRITGTGEEYEKIVLEKSRLENEGFRVVGDLIYELGIPEHSIFMERKNQ